MVNEKFILILTGMLILGMSAFAAPKYTTFQIKISNPDSTPLTAASVTFKFSTLPPTGSCILYSEQFSAVNMTTSSGFANFNLGTGTLVFSGYGTGYTDVYNNSAASMNCSGGGTYTPSVNDRRRIIVQFNDGTSAGWQTLNPIDINAVPYSTYSGDSEKLAGHPLTDFILASILPGSACSGSQVLTYSGGVLSCVASGTGTVTSVTSANSYLSVLNGTSTPALTVNVGTVANTLAAGDDSRIVGAAQKANNLSDLASASTARTNLGLGTAAVLNAGTAANNLVQLDGSAKIPSAVLPTNVVSTATALVGDVTGTIGATVVSTVGSKTAAQVAQSVTDTLAATDLNTASTIVKRDASGNFTAGTVTATNLSSTNVSTKNVYLYDSTNTNRILVKAPTSGITNHTLIFPATQGAASSVLTNDGSGNLSWAAPAATGVTSVTSANTDIGVANSSTTPVLTLNSGTSANQILKLDGTAKIPAVDGSQVTNLDPTKLSAAVAINKGGTGATTASAAINNLLPTQTSNAGKVLQTDGTNVSWAAASAGTVTSVTGTAPISVATGTTTPVISIANGTAAGQTLRWDGTSSWAKTKLNYTDLINNVSASPWPASSCTAGQAITWSSASDSFSCTTLTIATSQLSGTIAAANGGTGQSTFAVGDILYASTTSALSRLPASTAGYVLTSTGAGSAPVWQAATGNASTANPLSQFAATTSAQLASVLSDETGTGLAVFNTAPTFATNITSPMIIGGSTTTSSLTYKTTTAAGASGADHIFQVGNNGATEAMRILNSGNVGIGTVTPAYKLDVAGDVNITGNFKVNGVNISTGGGSVTNVSSANTDIGVANSSTTPTLTLNSGTSANQILKLDGSAKIPAVDGSQVTNLDPTKLSAAVAINKGGTGATTASAAINNLLPTQTSNSGKVLQTDGTNVSWAAASGGTVTSVTGTAPINVATGTTTPVISIANGTAAGQTLRWDGTSAWAKTKLNYTDLINNVSASPWPASSCTAGQAITWSSASDTFSCTTIALSASNFSSQTANTFLAAPNGSAGTPTFRTIASSDLPAGIASQWTTTGSDIYYSTGKVGIGLTSPAYKLDVAGDVNITGNFKVNGVNISTGGGSVTNVSSANTDIGVANSSTTPTLTLNSGTSANQILKLDGSAKIPAVDGSQVTNLDPTKLSAAVAINKGGTGATTASAAINNLLPTQTSNSGKVLQTDGTNVSWAAASGGTVTGVTAGTGLTGGTITSSGTIGLGAELTAVNGISTTGFVKRTAAATYSTASSISLTADVSGILPAANGGTGQSTFAVGDILYASTTSALSRLPASTAGYVLTSTGAGSAPVWQAATGNASTANPLSQFAATTSAQLASVLSDETGTGLAVFNTAPTFATNITSPMIIGGSTTTSSLTYKTTTAAGASGADHIFQVGNNGATEAMRILNSGNVGIGTSSAAATLDVNGTIKSAAVSNSSTTIDFSTGNLQYTSSACGSIILNNIKSGATYSLAVQGTAGGTCSFTAYSGNGTGALTVKTGSISLVQTASKHTIFTFLAMGSYVYVAAVDGF